MNGVLRGGGVAEFEVTPLPMAQYSLLVLKVPLITNQLIHYPVPKVVIESPRRDRG